MAAQDESVSFDSKQKKLFLGRFSMSAIVLVAFAIAATPDAGPAPEATAARYTTQPSTTPTSRIEWESAITEALRDQALADEMEQPRAVVQVMALHQAILQDDQLSPADRGRLRRKLRQRLLRVSEELAKDLAHRKTKVETVTRRAKIEARPEKLKKIETDIAVLAQWADVLAQVGGIAGPGGPAAGQRQQDLDHGEDLVELIQRVIAPNTWDVAGGPSSIVYFRGQRMLVISTTTEVHHKLAGLVNQLRRAGP